ncbi:ATP-binding protein [Pseudoxanthomonas sp. SL93]|jgi:serine/threonine-protein kinase RsbW|uniref:ATP-binding protein n=1 Tax=Pseudoxanthomonas sp. SL93 TaxID=2995142 RepID=UPI0022705829|nr:ATP-binding protein [Pseudoxanthomonas sp. SL93]WAC62692.1 ATP-binding protein [Pseudoxanthomonas sp. SL93]
MQMRLFIPREHARVDDLNASLEAVLQNNGVSHALQCDVRLIVEELASNAIEHGDVAQIDAVEHELCVDIGIRGNLLTLEFRESGAPFNPLSLPAPDLDAHILDRPTGGLGVHLIRQLAEETHYQRMGNYNILRVTLRIPTESEA